MSNYIQEGIPGVAQNTPFRKGNKNLCRRPLLLDYITKKLGCGKEQFAKMIGVSPATITKWLYSTTAPPLIKLNSIARCLGLSDEEVYELFKVVN